MKNHIYMYMLCFKYMCVTPRVLVVILDSQKHYVALNFFKIHSKELLFKAITALSD